MPTSVGFPRTISGWLPFRDGLSRTLRMVELTWMNRSYWVEFYRAHDTRKQLRPADRILLQTLTATASAPEALQCGDGCRGRLLPTESWRYCWQPVQVRTDSGMCSSTKSSLTWNRGWHSGGIELRPERP